MSGALELLKRSHTGLLVMDFQEKWASEIDNYQMAVANALRLILGFQMLDMPILVTELQAQESGNTAELVRKQFKLLEIIERSEFSCCRVPEFRMKRRALELNTLLICGFETHISVCQSVIELLQDGCSVYIVADAVSSRKIFDHEIALKRLVQAGAVLTTTEMSLFELIERTGTESYKHVMRMVRSKWNPRCQDEHGEYRAEISAGYNHELQTDQDEGKSRDHENAAEEFRGPEVVSDDTAAADSAQVTEIQEEGESLSRDDLESLLMNDTKNL